MPDPIYTPSGIIDIYNNSVQIPQERSVITIKGIYYRGTDQLYANQFYDSLTDEMGGTKITIKTNQLQRNKLVNGKLATVLGVLNRKIRPERSVIAVSINVQDILLVEEKKITDEERKRADIQLKKIDIGYRVPELIIKQKLYKNEKPKVALVFASGTIVQPEFTNALAYASEFIDFTKEYIAFSNAADVLNLLRVLAAEYEIIAIIRGGGAGQDLFDSLDFNSGILDINSCVISAIGHKAEVFFFKNIADKVVDTPTALGFFFKNLVDEVKSEISNSKAILTEQVKLQFGNQIKTITEQNEKLNAQIKLQFEQNEKLNTQVKLHLESSQKLTEQANKYSKELIETNKILNNQTVLLKDLQSKNDTIRRTKNTLLLFLILVSVIAFLLLMF